MPEGPAQAAQSQHGLLPSKQGACERSSLEPLHEILTSGSVQQVGRTVADVCNALNTAGHSVIREIITRTTFGCFNFSGKGGSQKVPTMKDFVQGMIVVMSTLCVAVAHCSLSMWLQDSRLDSM